MKNLGSSLRLASCLILIVAGQLSIGGLHANAQTNVLEELRLAKSEIAARKFGAAIRRLDQTINAGKMQQSNMARALYLRGRAKHASGRTAEAIADLNSAIWFGKLPSRQQKEAIALRQKAYQTSGVSAPSQTSSGLSSTQRAKAGPSTAAAPILPRIQNRPNASTRPAQHKVFQPIHSAGRLPDGRRRSTAAASATDRRQQTWPAQATAARPQPKPLPSWSQKVVTGTVRPVQRSQPPSQPIQRRKPAIKRAAVPKFRQETVVTRPPRTAAARTGTHVKTWSPLTQQYSSPPPKTIPRPTPIARPVESTPPPARVAVQPPSPPAAAPASSAPYQTEVVRETTTVAPQQPVSQKPPIQEEQPAATSALASMLFGSSPARSDAISAADRLQAERRARIKAHNKQFEKQ